MQETTTTTTTTLATDDDDDDDDREDSTTTTTTTTILGLQVCVNACTSAPDWISGKLKHMPEHCDVSGFGMHQQLYERKTETTKMALVPFV